MTEYLTVYIHNPLQLFHGLLQEEDLEQCSQLPEYRVFHHMKFIYQKYIMHSGLKIRIFLFQIVGYFIWLDFIAFQNCAHRIV